jgi:hypothetical protein
MIGEETAMMSALQGDGNSNASPWRRNGSISFGSASTNVGMDHGISMCHDKAGTMEQSHEVDSQR